MVDSWLVPGVFVGALVVLVFGAAGGPGWAAGHATLATDLERSASAPLYGLVAAVAAYLPAGEPGFRLAVMNAVIGAVLLAGVVRATRALLPKDPVAAPLAAIVLILAPPFRDAAGFAGPSILAACGLVWAVALAIEHAREPTARRALAVLACAGVTIGSAPWLGVLEAALLAGWLWRTGKSSRPLVLAAFGLGVVIVLWWLGAVGSLPGANTDLAAVVAAGGRGSAAIVVGAGLLGIAFGAVTNLASTRWVAGVLGVAALHAIVVADHDPVPLLALFALGCAVIPSAIVRVVPSQRRHVVAAVAAVPIAGAALLSGPAITIDDPGPAPARLASDLASSLPAGPGVFVTRRPATWSALEYARSVAGARPDYTIVPPLAATLADIEAVAAMRRGEVAASEAPSFGRLDPRYAMPRGRGFQLLLELPTSVPAVPPPARYSSRVGAEEAVLLAVDRARYEAVNLRLGAAARAAGLADRFGAGDLAILSTTMPSRPAFFGFLPELDSLAPGPWMIDLLGDDLAWTVGIDVPVADAPRARKLHALWRALWRGEIKRDDPAIIALGPAAVRATAELIATFAKAETPPPAR